MIGYDCFLKTGGTMFGETMQAILIGVFAIGAMIGFIYLRAWFVSKKFRKALWLIENSTPLIKSLGNYAEKVGIERIEALESCFAQSKIFPRHNLRFWESNPILKKITVPLEEVLNLLKNKHFGFFELQLAHEIGHQIVGIERLELQRECNIHGFCLSDEIRAWRQALEIIKELSNGIKNWRPQFEGRIMTFEEVYNFIENMLRIQCPECQKLVDSQKCPRTNDVKAARLHITRILGCKPWEEYL